MPREVGWDSPWPSCKLIVSLSEKIWEEVIQSDWCKVRLIPGIVSESWSRLLKFTKNAHKCFFWPWWHQEVEVHEAMSARFFFFFYYVNCFSVSLLKCQSSSDKALDIVFNVMCILTSEAHIFLWNQNLCILLGCTNWLGLIGFSRLPCSHTKSLIFPLKPASSYVIATKNCWGQKVLKASYMCLSLPIPSTRPSCQLWLWQASRIQPPLISMATTLVQTTVTFHLQAVVPPSHSVSVLAPNSTWGEPEKLRGQTVHFLAGQCATLRKEVLRMCAFSGYLPACLPTFRSLLWCRLGSETVTSTLYKV